MDASVLHCLYYVQRRNKKLCIKNKKSRSKNRLYPVCNAKQDLDSTDVKTMI